MSLINYDQLKVKFSNETKSSANDSVDTYIQWLQLQLKEVDNELDFAQLQVKFFKDTNLLASKNTDTYLQWLLFYYNNEYGVSLEFLSSADNGDILYYNGTEWVKLPIGDDGQVLTVDDNVPVWLDGGGGSIFTDETLTGDGTEADPLGVVRYIGKAYYESLISFIGFAPVGSLEAEAVWTVTKIVANIIGEVVSSVQTENVKWTEINLL